MINWKYCLIILILIELIYHLVIYYNSRLSIEPFYITFINCSKEFIRIKCHLGYKSRNFITKFYNWYKTLFRCHITEFDFYLSSIIRSIEIIIFISLLINIIC